MKAMTLRALGALLLIVACDGGPEPADGGPVVDAGPPDAGPPPPFRPDAYCPGGPACATGSGGTLYAGAARVDITPVITATTDVIERDMNGNGEFDPGDGDTYLNRDGVPGFQGVWMAGFGNARAATGVNDPQWVRAIAVRNGDTTIVLASLDLIGWFKSEMDVVREMVRDVDVDYIAFGATHSHEARDVIGIWGPTQDVPGRNAEYNAFVREQAARAVREAVANLRPAHVQYASADLREAPGGVRRYVNDVRDPWVVDPQIRILRFVDAADETATIGTVVNFGSHAEYLDSRNTLLSSDWPHWMREGIENGVRGPAGEMVDGIGGTTVFFQAAIGSQIGPIFAEVAAWDGTPIDRETSPFLYTETVGSQLAYFVLRALGPGQGAVTEETADLAFRNRSFFFTVQNTGYHIAILSGLFDREGENWDPAMGIQPGNEPEIRSEVAVIDIGNVTMMTVPGELDPVLFLGGYDGSYTPQGVPVVNTNRENPPDLSRAPSAPYLRDLARDDATQVWVLGLTNDFVGYLVPEFDYQLDSAVPYLEQAPGEHYEETNSVGVDGWPTLKRELTALLSWRPER